MKMKQRLVYTINLAKLEGEGDFCVLAAGQRFRLTMKQKRFILF